jgi:hypothetical protein
LFEVFSDFYESIDILLKLTFPTKEVFLDVERDDICLILSNVRFKNH